MAKSKRIKVGIIGTGGMANAHANAYKTIRGVELASCLDVVPGRAEAFAETHGFKHATRDMAEFLDQVDAVSIVTPDKFHAALCLQVLKAGKHVLCEKPLTLTLTDAKKVARAAIKASETKGLIHMVNFSYRNNAVFYAAAKLVADGKLGDLRHVHGAYLQHWLAADTWGHWTEEAWLWRIQTAAGSGGVLGDVGCHLLDFITGIAGDVKSLRCSLHTFPKMLDGKPVTNHKGKLDANDSAIIEMTFENGAAGLAHTTRWATGHPNHILFEAHGTEGALRIDLDEGGLKMHTCLGKDRHKVVWKEKTVRATPNNYQRFIKSIKTGVNDQADIVRGAQIQSYLDACERSAADGGKPMKIRKWT